MMKNSIVLLILVLLTLITAFVSGKQYALIVILLIADVKLFLVAFQFMELKKAHRIWIIVLSLLILLVTTILFVFRN